MRKRASWARRFAIARLYAANLDISQADLARRFGVTRSTICKDVEALGDYLSPYRIEDLPSALALYRQGTLKGNLFANVFKPRSIDTAGQLDAIAAMAKGPIGEGG